MRRLELLALLLVLAGMRLDQQQYSGRNDYQGTQVMGGGHDRLGLHRDGRKPLQVIATSWSMVEPRVE
jgi:hypothetical protein